VKRVEGGGRGRRSAGTERRAEVGLRKVEEETLEDDEKRVKGERRGGRKGVSLSEG